MRHPLSRRGASPAGARRLVRRAGPLGLLIGALFSAPAMAGPDDALHVYAGIGYNHDGNLLRVADGQPGFDNTLGDSWLQADGGLLFDHTYSRQRLVAQARLSKVKFDHFRQLDYDGKDVLATWYWQIGNHLEGKAGTSYAQTLAPYTDFRSSERNLRQDWRSFVDGAWRFHPSWRVRGGLAREKFSYDLSSQSVNDRTEDSSEAGFDYLAPSGSTVGLVARRLNGDYSNHRAFGGVLFDDSYRQDELKANVYWVASGTTTVQLLGGWVRRSQAALGDGATSGVNGKLSAEWTPRGKTSLNAALWRDFAPLESTLVSYTLNRGASVGAVWEASAKIKVDASAVYERRAYNPRLALHLPAGLADTIRSATLRATCAPARSIVLSAALVRQARSGSAFLGSGSFTSNSMAFNANAQF